jgi:hypothetical protein
MRIVQSHGGKPAGIAYAADADTAVIVMNFIVKVLERVVGVCAIVDRFRIVI